MKKYLSMRLVVILVLAPIVTAAQKTANPETDTIKWEYVDIQNQVRSEKLNISGQFISYAGGGFKWIQTGVDREYYFEVRSVEGKWTDADQDGELVYRAACKDIDGTIRISRQRRSITVVLDFIQPDKQTPHLILNVDSYTKM